MSSEGAPIGFRPHPGDFIDRHKGTHRSPGSKHRRPPGVWSRLAAGAILTAALVPALFLAQHKPSGAAVQAVPQWIDNVPMPAIAPVPPSTARLADRPTPVAVTEKPKPRTKKVAVAKPYRPQRAKVVPVRVAERDTKPAAVIRMKVRPKPISEPTSKPVDPKPALPVTKDPVKTPIPTSPPPVEPSPGGTVDPGKPDVPGKSGSGGVVPTSPCATLPTESGVVQQLKTVG